MIGDPGIPVIIMYSDVFAQEMKPSTGPLRIYVNAKTMTDGADALGAKGRRDIQDSKNIKKLMFEVRQGQIKGGKSKVSS